MPLDPNGLRVYRQLTLLLGLDSKVHGLDGFREDLGAFLLGG